MMTVGHSERDTQNRVIALFRDSLGYHYLGDWTDREDNSHIEEDLLSRWLANNGYTPAQISKALFKLNAEARNTQRSLYENNRDIYGLLRYGVPVKTEVGENTETVWLINWEQPERNDFAIAEEVTLHGPFDRRPDLVLYVNGIAIGVIELKNSRVSIGDGIRQLLSNQQKQFHEWFFSTVQFVFAGNDTEGLKYGTIGTADKYFLQWKEDEEENNGYKLDKYLRKMCNKQRLLELMHDFVLFDRGQKKLPRAHQYFGIKAAQKAVSSYKGGIIWHTQGSGKSIVMVLLAKWILENNPDARVLIITDRDELDKQIEGVFNDAGEAIKRTTSGHDLMEQLGQPLPRILCSLIHKFGLRGVDDFDSYIKDLQAQPSNAVGELFVFVDECHRTQSGKLHRAMKALMPNAVFIGFTGTPLLKKDSQDSREVFGGYIHTYKFNEAVEDGVVLDLVYEARNIPQLLASPDKVDIWFDAKTRGLNDWQKAALREHWGTLQRVLSSRSRMSRVVEDIVFDFNVKPCLINKHGNAMLVASSIYEACKYFELFQKTSFKGKCAVVTSYNPQTKDVTCEETGANTETERQFIYNTYTKLLKKVDAQPGKSLTETYEDRVKDLFKNQPALMQLLIVVDKLLTGFDAPSCTYLYIDKSMQDHGLFQAICRTNRLDGISKDFGYIVDYKDLFKKVENALSVYTSELDRSASGTDPDVMLQDRVTKCRERFENAREAIKLLCEHVQPPRQELDYIHYFCGNTEIPEDLANRAPLREALYKATLALICTYASIADELEAAGYSATQITDIKNEITHFMRLRDIIRKASGEILDLKPYEADMRHMIDTYIEADASLKISWFENKPLVELIEKLGIANAVADLPEGIRRDERSVAETINNNVRSKIIKEHLNDPAFYDRMSTLLEQIIEDLKAQRISYEQYLQKVGELVQMLQKGHVNDIPTVLKTSGMRAIYSNLKEHSVEKAAGDPNIDKDTRLRLALGIHDDIMRVRPDAWRGNPTKENVIKKELFARLNDCVQVEALFQIILEHPEY